MKEYTITLTEEEIDTLKDALNFQDVYKYHRKIDDAKKKGDKISEKFWTNEWYKSLNLFSKLVELTNEGEQ